MWPTCLAEPAPCLYARVLVFTVASSPLTAKMMLSGPSHSCESPQLHSSSGPWMAHDGQDVWKKSPEQYRPLHRCTCVEVCTPTRPSRLYFFSPVLMKGFLHDNTTQAGQAERRSFVPSKEQVVLKMFSCNPASVFQRAGQHVCPRCFVKELLFHPHSKTRSTQLVYKERHCKGKTSRTL